MPFLDVLKQIGSTLGDALSDDPERKAAALRKVPLPPGWTWHATETALCIAGSQLESAATHLPRLPSVTSSTVIVRQIDLLIEVATKDGYQVSARIVPLEVRLKQQTVTIICDLPDGVDVRHRSGVLSLLIRWFDGVFGFRKRAEQRVPGISADGRRVEWSQELTAKSKLGLALTGARTFGYFAGDVRLICRIVEGDLQVGPAVA